MADGTIRFGATVGDGGRILATSSRGHEIQLDPSPPAGESGVGPSPSDLMVMSLLACTAHYVRLGLEKSGASGEGVRVWGEPEGARNPSRMGRIAIHIELPANFDPAHEERVRRYAELCYVSNTLHHAPDITLEFHRAEG